MRNPSTPQPNNPDKTKMKKLLFTLTLAGALALGSTSAFAQAKKKPAAPAEAPAEKPKAADTAKPKAEGDAAKPKADGDTKAKRDTISFYGEVAAVDSTAKTITLKSKDPTKQRVLKAATATFTKVTGDTEAPAALSDVTADAYITGSYKKAADGSLEAVKVTLGKAKPVKKEGDAKKPAAEGTKPAAEPKKK